MKRLFTIFASLAVCLLSVQGCGKEPEPATPDKPSGPTVISVQGVSLSLSSLELTEGATRTVTATITPPDASDKRVTYSSSDENIATVDAYGNIKAICVGTATIYVTTQDGSKTASCVVTVTLAFDERAALMALYEATGGDNWTNKDNWCSDKDLSEWYGISVQNGHVTDINLYQNNLTGNISADIFSLPYLSSLDLGYNSLTGEIPGVFKCPYLNTLSLQHNYLTGPIPESLYDLENLCFIELWSNQLSGELSDRIWSMPALEDIAMEDNMISGQLTSSIRNAKKLTRLVMGNNLFTGTIPEEITELENLYIFSVGNKRMSNGSITKANNNFTGPIPANLDKLQNLWTFSVQNNNLEGTIPTCFANMPKLKNLLLNGNKFEGDIPEELSGCDKWESWTPDVNIVPQQDGYVLSFGHYESTDFSQDGKVIRLQEHQKGNGINIVITGDCFTDKDIASGEFESIARETMEYFFGVEPFTTFRNLFDVYAVVAVSKTTFSNYGTALGSAFGEGSAVGCDKEKVKEYTLRAVSDLNETLTIVIVNKNRDSGTAYWSPSSEIETDYGSGFSYACFGLWDKGVQRRLLINHEANGHAFTKLQDEYYYFGQGTFPEGRRQYYRNTYFSKGFYANIDFESDPTKVKWARFLSDDRYKNDLLGVFEGGMTWEKGVWRPSENSIMGHQQVGYDGDRFNAPSRLAAYIRIHKLAYGSDWELDYEEFVTYDAKNRKKSASALPSLAPSPLKPRQHTPPVFLDME